MWNSTGWKIWTVFQKTRIRLEDFLGLHSYQRWLANFEVTLSEAGVADQSSPVDIIVLLNSPEVSLHRATLLSLQAQSYRNWQALPVGLGEKTIERVKMDEPRSNLPVFYQPPVEPGSLLRGWTGDYLVFVENGDSFSPDFLSRAVQTLQEYPDAAGVYFDEDEQLAVGGLGKPHFWPDLSPGLLFSVPYLKHAVWRADALKSLNLQGVCPSFMHLQYLLMLQLASKADCIQHLAIPAYHNGQGRIADKSIYVDCLNEWLQQSSPPPQAPQAEINPQGQVHIACRGNHQKVSIIIPSHNHAPILGRALETLFHVTFYPNYEVIVVDQASQDPATLALYERAHQEYGVNVIQGGKDFNYSRFNNLGANNAGGELLLFLNDDIEIIDPAWLEEMAGWAERPGVGMVGAKLLYPGGTIQHAGVVVGLEGHASHVFGGMQEGANGPFGSVEWYRNYLAVTGACMLMPRPVFEQSHGFDERFQLVFSDIELGVRVNQLGYQVLYNPFARLIHHEGGSRRRDMPPEDLVWAYQELKHIVQEGDPFFNPNLSTAWRQPSLRRPFEEPAAVRLEAILRSLPIHHA